MLLKNVLNNLIRNELRNLSAGKAEWSDASFNYTNLVQCISLAYTELHKRFALRKERVLLRTLPGVTEYVLDIAHADSNTASSEDKYIADTSTRPFSNNIAKIDQIYDANGEPINFNTTSYGDFIEVLDYRTLFIPNPNLYTTLSLTCRALPEPIELADEGELETYELDLPVQYLEALILYAAGRVYVNRGAENATNNESAIFFARFEQAVVNIEQLGLNVKENMSNDKLSLRGFV
jgi:hypothetical protein